MACGAAALLGPNRILHTRTAMADATAEASMTTDGMTTDGDLLRSTFIKVGALPIHTLAPADATRQGPIVVLVHGLALSGRYMMPTAQLLARTYRVYVPDFPGFGDSGKPDHALDVPGLADALAAWMPEAGLERAVLLGNSFGCQIIADFAARYPERVDAAVLQGPTTPPDERTWLRQFIRWRQNSPYNPPSMARIARNDYRKCGLVRALVTFQYSLEDRIEDKLPRIRAPVLVVRGEKDPICSQAWAEEVTRRLPSGRLSIILDVAHTLVYTSPEPLARLSQSFIDTGEAPARL